jgi:hypothetical protein
LKLPHVLCITEHHLSSSEIQLVFIDNYTLRAYYCKKHILKGGVCVFVNENITSSSLNLETHCVDKDIEVCAVQLNLLNNKFCILIYGPPSGNFSKFMNYLEQALQLLYNPKIDLIICGDININYLEE